MMPEEPAAPDRSPLPPILAVVAVESAGLGMILPLLPFYASEFGATPLTIGLLLASFSLCELLAAPILGKASDLFGRKRLLVASQIGTCASFLLLALAPNLAVVFAARILGACRQATSRSRPPMCRTGLRPTSGDRPSASSVPRWVSARWSDRRWQVFWHRWDWPCRSESPQSFPWPASWQPASCFPPKDSSRSTSQRQHLSWRRSAVFSPCRR